MIKYIYLAVITIAVLLTEIIIKIYEKVGENVQFRKAENKKKENLQK